MELVRSGADASARTIGGICALTAAAEESQVLVMRALLKLGLPVLGGRRAWADALCSSARKGLVEGTMVEFSQIVLRAWSTQAFRVMSN